MPEKIVTLGDEMPLADCLDCGGDAACCSRKSAAKTPSELADGYARLAALASEYRAQRGEPGPQARLALLRASGLGDEWAPHPLTAYAMQANGIGDEEAYTFRQGILAGIRQGIWGGA